MTVEAVVDAVTTMTGGLTGIRQAPTDPTETANAFPFAVTYSGGGSYLPFGLGKALTRGVHRIVTEIHVARKDLPRDVAALIPFPDRYLAALQADYTLSGAIINIEGLDYDFGALQWGGLDTLGWRFTLTAVTDEC